MLTKNIFFKNFNLKKKNSKVRKNLYDILNEKNQILFSLSKNYKYSYFKSTISKFKKKKKYRVIGMGGSTLGAQSIYDFLKHKINKKFIFVDNLQANTKKNLKENFTNLVISKSGNTIETIVNVNLFIKKNNKNIFITENKNNYLFNLAQKIKAEIIHHNNFIGGRYSVLSEVGMLPAELMGLNPQSFKQYNALIKNKHFLNALIDNVTSTLFFIKKKKLNSVIVNYDEKSENLFKWYQQLIAESLGKKKNGLLPIISNMPKDNHSVMHLYLDGYDNNFFTFFIVNDLQSERINNQNILTSHNFLKNKNISQIINSQKNATERVFRKKNIPFRTFEIKKRNEKTLGELFCFFILETILLGRTLKVNPYDQPAVELIKQETRKILI